MNCLLPQVSVIIPTFRRPDTLDRAINSVLGQSYPNVEVIVVDDNNPDTDGRRKTEEKMSAFADNPRVKYIKHEKNKNGSAARNTGAKASKGKYVAFLDDDDEFLPNKIESQVKRLESLPEDWGCCYSKYYTQIKGKLEKESPESTEGYIYMEALMHKVSFAAGSNLMVRKSVFDEVGGFDESFQRSQDHELLTKIARKYKVAYVSEPGLIVHVHNNLKQFDYEEIINRYITSFKPFIDELSNEQKTVFWECINGNRFYHFLRDKKDIKSCLKMISRHEISIHQALKIVYKKTINYIKNRL